MKGLAAGNGSETGGWVIDEAPQSEYTDAVKASYKDYNDAAIVVFMRTGAEGNDLPYDMSRYGGSAEEHYLELNQNEKDLLAFAKENFTHTIVLINSAAPMELGFIDSADVWLLKEHQEDMARAVARGVTDFWRTI